MLPLLFKTLGAALIICCGWTIGNGTAKNLRRRCDFYQDMITLCELLENNALYLRRALPDFFAEELTHRSFLVLHIPELKETPFLSWRAQAWEEISGQSGLSLGALEDARIFWNALGSSGSEQEAERIRYYRSVFEQSLAAAKNVETKSARVYRSLGICGGMVAALLIL